MSPPIGAAMASSPLHLMRPTPLALHLPTSLPSLPVLLHSALLDVFPLVTNVVDFATLPFWTLLSTGKPHVVDYLVTPATPANTKQRD